MSDDPAGDPELDPRREDLRRQAHNRSDRWLAELLGDFADHRLKGMTGVELDSFADLLAQPDADIHAWVTGQRSPPEELGIPALEMIIDHRKAQGEAGP